MHINNYNKYFWCTFPIIAHWKEKVYFNWKKKSFIEKKMTLEICMWEEHYKQRERFPESALLS
jgi:hypothetical protein